MKYCDKCGYELRDEDNFCPNCGDKVSENAKDNNNQYVDEHNEFISKLRQQEEEKTFYTINKDNEFYQQKENPKINVLSIIIFILGIISFGSNIFFTLFFITNFNITKDWPFYFIFINVVLYTIVVSLANVNKKKNSSNKYDPLTKIAVALATISLITFFISFMIMYNTLNNF